MGPQGPIWGGIAPKRRHMGPLGPLWGGIAPESLHMGPLGPLMGRICSQPSRATAAFLAGAFFFSAQKTTFLDF